MSDYSSTFTEETGDTIDVSDFTTEFNSISTAIASKADLSGATITGATINSSTVNGGSINSGTALTSPTAAAYTFTGIPSWVKRVTVAFDGLSSDTTTGDYLIVRVGNDSTFYTTGYDGGFSRFYSTTSFQHIPYTAGAVVAYQNAAAQTSSGQIVFTKFYAPGTEYWSWQGASSCPTQYYVTSAGITPAITTGLTRIQVRCPTDDIDAGTVNIIYEG